MDTSMDLSALIPAAGLGTRMVPATKEAPKEMLPLPQSREGGLVFKPFLQIVFENLYDAGVRVFVFVVGRGKRIIQDHFIVDWSFHDLLISKGKEREARSLARFYEKVEDSTIIWVDQPSPKGLGDAVLRGLKAVSTGKVIVHLGDVSVYTPDRRPVVDSFVKAARKIEGECGNTIHTMEVRDPRRYGVIIPGSEWRPTGVRAAQWYARIRGLIEKPSTPPSNYVVSGMYYFATESIMAALENAGTNDSTGEVELTDALVLLAEKGELCAVLSQPAVFIDIGTPSLYLEAIRFFSQNP